MTKISQLSSIGDSLAIGDQFLIRDIDDAGSPNKSVTVSGITRALADGDATAPALAFAADKNTGIYRAGTDSLAVATNGTGRLFVDASGNVGVGTASPNASSKLHVADGDVLISKTSGYASLFFNFIGVGTARAASIKKNYDSPFELRIQGGNNSAAAPICFDRADGFENARFDDSGRLGIGTSAPTTRFHVDFGDAAANSIRLVGDGATNGTALATNWFSGASYFDVRLGGNTTSETKLRVTSAGNVGIGTASPSSLLHLADAGDITVGTTTGTKIGTATTQKIGFYNATPVVQPTAVADATTAVDVITQLNALLAKLRTLGIIAT